MPPGEFSTPGPFKRTKLTIRWGPNTVLRFMDNLDDAERDEIEGLLNKGKHFERLIDALNRVSELLSTRSPMTRSEERLAKEHDALAEVEAALSACGWEFPQPPTPSTGREVSLGNRPRRG